MLLAFLLVVFPCPFGRRRLLIGLWRRVSGAGSERCVVFAEESVVRRSPVLGAEGRRAGRRRTVEPQQVRVGPLQRRSSACSPAPPTWRREPAVAGLCNCSAGSLCGARRPAPSPGPALTSGLLSPEAFRVLGEPEASARLAVGNRALREVNQPVRLGAA